MTTGSSASAGRILELVRSGQVRTRRELQEVTGLSRSTLSLRMSQLAAAGYVRETGQVSGSTGRPAKVLSFDASGQLVVAVDLGAHHAHLALIDGAGRMLLEASGELKIDAGPDDVLRYVTRRITELIARSGRSIDEVAGVGVGIPGPVRFATQRPNTPPLMPGWHDYPVAERLREALGVPVFVDNDANLMALGEARARYADVPSVLFVKVGTGIGAGVILHGQPERGIAGGAGDIGHIRIAPPGEGRPCTCGATGCLATEASGGALARQLTEAGTPADTAQDVATLIAAGDPLALRLSERAGHLLGEVLATSVALLNPAVLVLGGLLPSAGPVLLEAVRESVFQRTVPLATRELTIATTTLGADAAVQGARHLVIDQTFSAAAVDARLAASS
ncbi:putative NBD/HSP70 family sugar kinase [Diaminobutyricimonas aerilata]|uniref:Putative NBD/HSP70 family sugar kinase n=1 Tax=Diaminobutyricimonas aerilata TaxID=1162967 RepID=A0A2M9CL34_9MICO|nr:ROK family transcriptional regulator [Diaminobutyricimonas aerilata]PJJ72602.1 putative NBD/HSP70 family sugar kinase [Diaminobutyricimonas aerilata]